MQREIKFRAWDGKEMFLLQMIRGKFSIEFVGKFCRPMKGDEVLMQSTSLKDKNGKEIYEGDIVYSFRNGRNQPTRGKVEYIQSEGAFRLNDEGYLHRLDNLNRREVIGNLYENPDLINPKDL